MKIICNKIIVFTTVRKLYVMKFTVVFTTVRKFYVMKFTVAFTTLLLNSYENTSSTKGLFYCISLFSCCYKELFETG